MAKFIRVTMPDGAIFDVPAANIAHDRAIWYVSQYGSNYDEKYNETLADEFELMDWAENNLNWDEVQDQAAQVKLPSIPDYIDGWVNGAKEIVEKEEGAA